MTSPSEPIKPSPAAATLPVEDRPSSTHTGIVQENASRPQIESSAEEAAREGALPVIEYAAGVPVPERGVEINPRPDVTEPSVTSVGVAESRSPLDAPESASLATPSAADALADATPIDPPQAPSSANTTEGNKAIAAVGASADGDPNNSASVRSSEPSAGANAVLEPNSEQAVPIEVKASGETLSEDEADIAAEREADATNETVESELPAEVSPPKADSSTTQAAPATSKSIAATVDTTTGPREVQFAIFGKHPSHDDYYLFNDTGSDAALAWFEASIARQLRDAHPGDAPGCYDRWILWIGKAQTLVAAAWDSRDSRGRARTPLFACIAVDRLMGASFVGDAVSQLITMREKLFGEVAIDRDQFLTVARAEVAALQSLVRPDTVDDTSSVHATRRANDVLRAVGLDDLSTAAALFPQAGLAAKLRRAGRMLRAFSVKPSPEAAAKERCLDQHCRVHQPGLGAAASLDGWAALMAMTGQSGPLGVIASESGVVDLYASKAETVNLSGVYEDD